MSIRKLVLKCYQHGRQIIQGVLHKGETIGPKPKDGRVQVDQPKVDIRGHLLPPKGTQQHIKPGVFGGLVYRARLGTVAGELRRKAALQFLGGNLSRNVKNTPIFAFVSIALAANQTFEQTASASISSQIREMFKAREVADRSCSEGSDDQQHVEVGLDNLEFGQLISTGCDAAVYEARLKREQLEESEVDVVSEGVEETVLIEASSLGEPFQSGCFLTDMDDISDTDSEDSDITVISDLDPNETWLDVGEDGALAVFSVSPVLDQQECDAIAAGNPMELVPDDDYDLAVKVMFNYGTESNSDAIMRAMEKETIPAKMADTQSMLGTWENGSRVKKKVKLPPHPNIVDMRSVFVGSMPRLADAMQKFPAALPPSINPDGLGRNLTMFLVMKKYTHNLREYLEVKSLSLRASLLMFTQLLEGIVHLVQHGIAHRDLKTNNILVEEEQEDSVSLAISDFGCGLMENSLKVPFPTSDMLRGGNTALMAPEIACALPGRSSYLDFSQSDLWAAGALAYEIFGGSNPFYREMGHQRLDSRTYTEEQLPALPGEVPHPVQSLVTVLLKRDPQHRPLPEVAANLLHVYMWGPEEWPSGKQPTESDVVQWLLTLTAQVLCEGQVKDTRSRCFKGHSKVGGSRSNVEFELKKTFLSRVRVDEVMAALHFLHS